MLCLRLIKLIQTHSIQISLSRGLRSKMKHPPSWKPWAFHWKMNTDIKGEHICVLLIFNNDHWLPTLRLHFHLSKKFQYAERVFKAAELVDISISAMDQTVQCNQLHAVLLLQFQFSRQKISSFGSVSLQPHLETSTCSCVKWKSSNKPNVRYRPGNTQQLREQLINMGDHLAA